jgi:hypothetical protein
MEDELMSPAFQYEGHREGHFWQQYGMAKAGTFFRKGVFS